MGSQHYHWVWDGSSKPNMQRSFCRQYRKMFVAKPGWKLVDSVTLLQSCLYPSEQAVTVCIEQGMTFRLLFIF
jgi:hypothetical protein